METKDDAMKSILTAVLLSLAATAPAADKDQSPSIKRPSCRSRDLTRRALR